MKAKPAAGARTPPRPAARRASLGRACALWDELRERLASAYGPFDEKWSYADRNGRWSLRLKRRKDQRTVVHMILAERHFVAGFALGEKACADAARAGLREKVLEAIEAAPRYAEGRGLWLDVRVRRDLADVEAVAALRMAH